MKGNTRLSFLVQVQALRLSICATVDGLTFLFLPPLHGRGKVTEAISESSCEYKVCNSARLSRYYDLKTELALGIRGIVLTVQAAAANH